MCLNPYLKKMSSQINDCSYIWVNCDVIALRKEANAAFGLGL